MQKYAHRHEFQSTGRVWLRGFVEAAELKTLAELGSAGANPGARFGPESELFRTVRQSIWAEKLASIWPGAKPVRIVSFDKSESLNWKLGWHQDRVIAVQERHDCPGFTNWSQKAGKWHCEPPETILNGMLFVRIHIDACDETNGAMVFARGSHRSGKARREAGADTSNRYSHETCIAEPGDVLVLNMLTWHMSPASETLSPRRSLRVDFALEDLPAPLQWPG